MWHDLFGEAQDALHTNHGHGVLETPSRALRFKAEAVVYESRFQPKAQTSGQVFCVPPPHACSPFVLKSPKDSTRHLKSCALNQLAVPNGNE